jgi:hypothetical protein
VTNALQDPIGLALGSIGAGATTGAAVVTAGTVIVRLLPEGGSGDAAFGVLTGGALLGIAVAVTCTVIVTAAIADLWRRAVAGAIAAFLAILLGAISAPADRLAGRIGLAVYLLLLIGAAIVVWRRTLSASR